MFQNSTITTRLLTGFGAVIAMLITVAAILGSITFAILFEKLLFREGIK
jgi:hypothetical protein